MPSPNSRSMPGAIALSIAYGIDSKSADDQFLRANIEASHAATAAMVPGKFLVDVIPIRGCLCAKIVTYKRLTYPLIVRYLPEWFPGMGFKVVAKEVREKFRTSIDGPMEYVKNAMKVCPQSSPRPYCVLNTSLTNSLARGFPSASRPIVCLVWRVMRKWLLMKEQCEMSQVSCLPVSLFRKIVHAYSRSSLFTIGAAATVRRDSNRGLPGSLPR